MDVVAGIRETVFAGRVVVEGGAGVFGEKAEEGAKGLRAEGALEGVSGGKQQRLDISGTIVVS